MYNLEPIPAKVPQFKVGDRVRVVRCALSGCKGTVLAVYCDDICVELDTSPDRFDRHRNLPPSYLEPLTTPSSSQEIEFAFHISGMHIDPERKGNVIVSFSPDAESNVIDGALYLPFTAEAVKALSWSDEYVVSIRRK